MAFIPSTLIKQVSCTIELCSQSWCAINRNTAALSQQYQQFMVKLPYDLWQGDPIVFCSQELFKVIDDECICIIHGRQGKSIFFMFMTFSHTMTHSFSPVIYKSYIILCTNLTRSVDYSGWWDSNHSEEIRYKSLHLRQQDTSVLFIVLNLPGNH